MFNYIRNCNTLRSWYSAVGLANGYRLDDRGVDRSSSPGRLKNFLFSTSSTLTLGSTQLPIQWVPGALSLGGKAAGGVKLYTHLQLVLRSRNMDLYIHFPLRLHGVALNWLSTGTTLPYLTLPYCNTYGKSVLDIKYVSCYNFCSKTLIP
jgi:hypothetical protein